MNTIKISSRYSPGNKRTGRAGKARPYLRISGKALESIGLAVGSQVKISCEGGRLIIEPV